MIVIDAACLIVCTPPPPRPAMHTQALGRAIANPNDSQTTVSHPLDDNLPTTNIGLQPPPASYFKKEENNNISIHRKVMGSEPEMELEQ